MNIGVLGQGDGGAVKEPAAPGVKGEFGDLEHGWTGARLAQPIRNVTAGDVAARTVASRVGLPL